MGRYQGPFITKLVRSNSGPVKTHIKVANEENQEAEANTDSEWTIQSRPKVLKAINLPLQCSFPNIRGYI